jgi:hypothetical protein
LHRNQQFWQKFLSLDQIGFSCEFIAGAHQLIHREVKISCDPSPEKARRAVRFSYESISQLPKPISTNSPDPTRKDLYVEHWKRKEESSQQVPSWLRDQRRESARWTNLKIQLAQSTRESAGISKRYCTKSNNKKQLEENTLTTSSSKSSTTFALTTACYAQGLVVTHPRKLSATLGGSTSTCPGVRRITLKTCYFIDISNTAITTTVGGSTATSPPIVDTIVWQ